MYLYIRMYIRLNIYDICMGNIYSYTDIIVNIKVKNRQGRCLSVFSEILIH